MKPRSGSIQRSAPPKRSSKPIRKKKRSPEEQERIYGPPGFVEWVQSLPSVASGLGPCEAAHVGKKGAGGSRKADWDQIVPLTQHEHIGELHQSMGPETFQQYYGIVFEEELAKIQRLWLSRSSP